MIWVTGTAMTNIIAARNRRHGRSLGPRSGPRQDPPHTIGHWRRLTPAWAVVCPGVGVSQCPPVPDQDGYLATACGEVDRPRRRSGRLPGFRLIPRLERAPVARPRTRPEPSGIQSGNLPEAAHRQRSGKPLRKPSQAAFRKMAGADPEPHVEALLGTDM